MTTLLLTELKSQLLQLMALHTAGRLSEAAFVQARSELERRITDAVLADDLTTPVSAPHLTGGATGVTPLRHWLLLAALAMLCVAAGYGGVTLLKQANTRTIPEPLSIPRAAALAPTAPALAVGGSSTHDTGTDQITAMVERLAQKMKTKPQDAEGWAMLARSYGVLGRHTESLAAYKKALALRKDDAVLQADYARALQGSPSESTAPKP